MSQLLPTMISINTPISIIAKYKTNANIDLIWLRSLGLREYIDA